MLQSSKFAIESQKKNNFFIKHLAYNKLNTTQVPFFFKARNNKFVFSFSSFRFVPITTAYSALHIVGFIFFPVLVLHEMQAASVQDLNMRCWVHFRKRWPLHHEPFFYLVSLYSKSANLYVNWLNEEHKLSVKNVIFRRVFLIGVLRPLKHLSTKNLFV